MPLGFERRFERRVKRTIMEHGLINKDERIAVACSGGKDSAVMLHLLNKLGCKTEAVFIDLGMGSYTENSLKSAEELCAKEGVKLRKISLKKETGKTMPEIIKNSEKSGISPCVACGTLKRYILNKKSRELGADRIAMGHNLDDIAETVVISMITGKIELAMRIGPVTESYDKRMVSRIRPLFFSEDCDVLRYCRIARLPFFSGKCRYSSNALRPFVRKMIIQMEEKCPGAKKNIVSNFIKIKEKWKGSRPKLKSCMQCGEPSLKNLCRACRIINAAGIRS